MYQSPTHSAVECSPSDFSNKWSSWEEKNNRNNARSVLLLKTIQCITIKHFLDLVKNEQKFNRNKKRLLTPDTTEQKLQSANFVKNNCQNALKLVWSARWDASPLYSQTNDPESILVNFETVAWPTEHHLPINTLWIAAITAPWLTIKIQPENTHVIKKHKII